MQPLHYDLKSPAAKDNSITNAATARSNLDTAIYIAGTILELQITMQFHQQLIYQHHLHPIYNAGTILQLQITMEFCRPHMHEKQLTPHLQCGTDPRMIQDRSDHDPTTHETVSHPSHRRGRSSRFGDTLCMEKHRVSCICYLSKTHFVRDFLQNSIGNSSGSTTCNPIYSEGTILELQITMQFHQQLIHQHHLHPIYNAGTILQLQITMEFCRPHMHEKPVDTPFTMRNRSENDPRPIRP